MQLFVISVQFAWKSFNAHLHKVTNNLQYLFILDLGKNNLKYLFQFQRTKIGYFAIIYCHQYFM